MASGSAQAETRSSLLVRSRIHSELDQSWWMYPIARFFGHALYEYRYDIDFRECTAAINQERNLILYQSYCDFFGSLVAKRVQDHDQGTKPQDVIMGIIGFAFIHSEDKREGILNLLRATRGVHHFGCVIMRYCNFFKCLCLEDMKTCVTSTDLKLHAFWKQVIDSLSQCIHMKEHHKYYEELQNIFDLRENFNLPSALISIPFICEIGIKLNSGPDYDDLMKDLQSQFTIAISHKQATEYVQGTEETSIKEIGYILMDKEKAPEDKNKRSGDKDTRDDITEDIKLEDESEFMSPHEGTQHEEIRTTEKTMSSLSPYEAIQAVIDKFKSANEPIPASLLSNLSHLKIKDPYSEYTRTKSSKSHSPPSASQSKSTKGLLAPTTSQSKSAKGWSPPSTSQSKATKGLSPSQSSAAVISHAVTPPAPIHKPKGRSLSPKLAFSSGLFSSDAAKSNKIIVNLPNSDNSRENYILNEYDCRMKKHITFQAVTFELLNTKKGLHKVSNLIHQQRRFEERWPSRYSEASPSEEFYDESVFDTNIEEIRETDMTEMIQESKQPIRMLQHLLNSVDSIKRR